MIFAQKWSSPGARVKFFAKQKAESWLKGKFDAFFKLATGQMLYGLSPNPYTWTPKAHISLRGTPTQAERDNKTVYSRNVISFSVCLMKSLRSNDEIFTSFRWNPRTSPRMKSNPSKYNPAKQDFIAWAISSTIGGFHPSKTDLIACSPLRITRITPWFLLF